MMRVAVSLGLVDGLIQFRQRFDILANVNEIYKCEMCDVQFNLISYSIELDNGTLDSIIIGVQQDWLNSFEQKEEVLERRERPRDRAMPMWRWLKIQKMINKQRDSDVWRTALYDTDTYECNGIQ